MNKWKDYVPDNAESAYVYAKHVFWLDDKNEIICRDSDIETFNEWLGDRQ